MDMVEFRSASSEIRGQKKKEDESVVKYKSADNYVGRPKKGTGQKRIAVSPATARRAAKLAIYRQLSGLGFSFRRHTVARLFRNLPRKFEVQVNNTRLLYRVAQKTSLTLRNYNGAYTL